MKFKMFRTNLTSIMLILKKLFDHRNQETDDFAKNFQGAAKIAPKVKLTDFFLQNVFNGPTCAVMYFVCPFKAMGAIYLALKTSH